MDKILITIYVLSLDEYYDLFVPINSPTKEIYDMIQNAIVELSRNNYQKHENAMLITGEGKIINNNNVVRLSGLTNGCTVVLL